MSYPAITDFKGVKVGFSQSEPDNASFRAAKTKSMRDEATKEGADLLTANANKDPQKQIPDIKDLITKGAKMLIVAPNSDSLQPAWDAAAAAKVPVVTVDRLVSQTPCKDYLTFIGSDFIKQGMRATDAAGELEPVDPRQTTAFGYTAEVAIDRQAYDAAIRRDDDGEHVDINARTVDVLWRAKVSLDAHPFPQRVPFTVWPADRPVNLAAVRGTGDMGEQVVTITTYGAALFAIHGTTTAVPALDYLIGAGQLVPGVTVQVLHVLLAALTDTESVAAFHVQDAPDNPVTVTMSDGRTATLRSHIDGTYTVGLLAEYTAAIV